MVAVVRNRLLRVGDTIACFRELKEMWVDSIGETSDMRDINDRARWWRSRDAPHPGGHLRGMMLP